MLKRYNFQLLKIHKLLFAQIELQTIQDKAKNPNRDTISPLHLVSFEKPGIFWSWTLGKSIMTFPNFLTEKKGSGKLREKYG